MSAESDFRAALLAHAALVALVPASRIAQNAVPDGAGLPCIVYTATRIPDFHLSNSVGATNVRFSTQCWAETAAAASAVADEVTEALLAIGTVCTSRTSVYDTELGLDGEDLECDWWE